MKWRARIVCLTVVAAAAAIGLRPAGSGAAESSAANYTLDAAHCAVVFRISHMGMSYTYGRFNDVSGRFAVDSSDTANSSFDCTIKTASIDTNHKKRDDHLRSPDFFDARQFPVMTFKTTGIHAHGPKLHLTGDLSMHGVTRPIDFHMDKMGEGKDPWGKQRIGFSAAFKIKRSDFGMKQHLKMVGDEVELLISFEGVRE